MRVSGDTQNILGNSHVTPDRFVPALRALNNWDNAYFGEFAFLGSVSQRKQLQVVHLALSVIEYTPTEYEEYVTWLRIGEEPDGARKLVEIGLRAPKINQKRTKELRANCDPALFVMDALDKMSGRYPNFQRSQYAIESAQVTRKITLSGIHRPDMSEQLIENGKTLLAS